MTQPASAPEVQISVKPDAAIQNPTAPIVQSPQDDDAVLARLGAEMDSGRKAKEGEVHASTEDDGLGESPRDGSEVAAEGTPSEEEVEKAAADAALSPVDRAKAAAARARDSAGRNRQLMEQQKVLARQNAAAQERIHALQAQNEQAARFQQQLAQDPYAALKQLGMTEEQLAHRAVREGTPEALIEKVQRQLAEERQARIALENRLVNERQQIALRSAENAFVQLTSDDSKFPLLSELPAKTVLLLAKSATEELVAQGYDVSDFPDSDLCALVEHKLKEGRRGKKAAAQPPPEAKPKPPPVRTLTNALGTSKHSMPSDFDSLSQDEQFAHLGKMAELNLKKQG